jgi:hypothetical protein
VQAQVLNALLYQFMSREERANALPEAFTPPGIPLITSTIANNNADESAMGKNSSGLIRQRHTSGTNYCFSPLDTQLPQHAVRRACTTPHVCCFYELAELFLLLLFV